MGSWRKRMEVILKSCKGQQSFWLLALGDPVLARKDVKSAKSVPDPWLSMTGPFSRARRHPEVNRVAGSVLRIGPQTEAPSHSSWRASVYLTPRSLSPKAHWDLWLFPRTSSLYQAAPSCRYIKLPQAVVISSCPKLDLLTLMPEALTLAGPTSRHRPGMFPGLEFVTQISHVARGGNPIHADAGVLALQ